MSGSYYNCSKSFDLVLTFDEDLEITWTIGRLCNYHECTLTEIKLDNCDKEIFGSFEFAYGPVEDVTRITFTKGTFDTKILPFSQNLDEVTWSPPSYISININIHLMEDRVVLNDYDRFFMNESLKDVTIVVGGEEVKAHKSILCARNDVFERMFDTDMLEIKGRVEITDIEPHIFRLFLRFMYSGKLESRDTEELLKLVVAADKYSVKDLVEVCSTRLLTNLSVENVIYVLMIADLVKEDFLKRKCVNFFIKNKNGILDTEGYKEIILKAGRADLVSDVMGD